MCIILFCCATGCCYHKKALIDKNKQSIDFLGGYRNCALKIDQTLPHQDITLPYYTRHVQLG